MAESLTYHLLDGFTDRRFSGNPLAVKDVLDLLRERGVPAERIVREFYYAY